ncbi:hypothetical protein [Nitrosopumilus sp.]|uniref:hypothetical protein n=1 Tax=Nitrosopumilus sp. TaxID=2024843 RepID=UPI00292E73A5|nr:hypothetical protein [Nitrosopumilus sp.]
MSYGKTSLNTYTSKNVIESIGKQNMKNIEPKIMPESLSSAKNILENAPTIDVTVAPIVVQITSILGMIR